MHSRIIGLTAAGLAGAILASASWAVDDAVFIQDAIKGSLAEVKMGQLAQQNGATTEVRSLGSKLMSDHSATLNQATSLAQSIGAPVPEQPSPDALTEYTRLQNLRGAAFDKAFVDHMVADHKKEIAKFGEQARTSSDPVAQFAKSSLPALQMHLDMAQDLARQQK